VVPRHGQFFGFFKSIPTGLTDAPRQLRGMVREYALAAKDPFMLGDVVMPWFNSFVTCEVRFGLFFYFSP
jgi:hypothetical protein